MHAHLNTFYFVNHKTIYPEVRKRSKQLKLRTVCMGLQCLRSLKRYDNGIFSVARTH